MWADRRIERCSNRYGIVFARHQSHGQWPPCHASAAAVRSFIIRSGQDQNRADFKFGKKAVRSVTLLQISVTSLYLLFRLDNAVIANAPPAPPRRRRANHQVCHHFQRLIAWFAAACPLGISSLPNSHRSWPWSAPKVWHPPKTRTGCPWNGTTRRRLQHSVKTRPLSVSGIRSPWIGIGTTAKRVPYHKGR
jgi:hypothetical protein